MAGGARRTTGRGDHRDQRHPAGRHHARAPHHLHGDDEDRRSPDGAARSAQGGDRARRRPGGLQHHAGGRRADVRRQQADRRTTTPSSPLAKDAQQQHSDLRAVIKADAAVTHGRVIHVLDLLKQAHVNKIAFGVHARRRRAALTGAARAPAMNASDAATQTATNGAARCRACGSFAAASAVPYDDPMSKVLGLDAKTSSLAAWLGLRLGRDAALRRGSRRSSLFIAWWHTVHLPQRRVDDGGDRHPARGAAAAAPADGRATKPEPAPSRACGAEGAPAAPARPGREGADGRSRSRTSRWT